MVTAEHLPRLLTIDQVAEHLGTSRRHIRRLIAERRIPYVKVGRLIRFDPSEVAAWLDQNRRPDRSASAPVRLPARSGPAGRATRSPAGHPGSGSPMRGPMLFPEVGP